MDNIELKNKIKELKKTGELYNIKQCINICKLLYEKNMFNEIKNIYYDFLNKELIEHLNQWKSHRTYYKNNKLYKLQEMFYRLSKYW